ncbi:MAG: hypothetical protein HYY99_00955 [Candidatus Colwellbacteria bacterium]|nr:hypothetical protein [Candidatus Colwellbacteria bacterium]MBI3088818.1 hypothetical protein [Candidatus Colwellbacteria bacterium]
MVILSVLVVGWIGKPIKVVEGKINALLMAREREERVLLLGAGTPEEAEEILGQSKLAAAVIGSDPDTQAVLELARELRRRKGSAFLVIGVVDSALRDRFVREGRVDFVCDPDEVPANLIFYLRKNNLVRDPPPVL